MVFVRQNELIFHHQIADKVERYNIPDSLILNFDQTPSKYVPVASTTLAKFETSLYQGI